LRVFMKWFVWMWRVVLSLANIVTRASGTPRTGNDGYAVQGCGPEGGGSEVLCDAMGVVWSCGRV